MQTQSRSIPRGLNAPVSKINLRWKNLLKAAGLGLCLLPFAAGVAQAQTTLLSENFNSYANGDGIPSDWYRIGVGNPLVQDGQLRWGFASPAVTTSFDSVTLESSGDYIQASIDVRYTNAPSGLATGSSLALYDSGGTPVAASTADASVAGHVGYKVYKAFDATVAAPNDFALFSNSQLSRFRFAGAGNTEINPHATGTGIALNTTYTVSLNIERLANDDLFITYSFGDLTETHTVAAANVLTYTFDEIGINLFAGDFPGAGLLDNVLVTTNVIPEPSASALLLGGLCALIAVGRGRGSRQRK